MSERPLAGRNALVTGGGRGIGRGIALRLAAGGATVAVNYRNDRAAAEATVAAIIAAGGTAHCYQCDVAANFGAVSAMVDRVATELGGLDILINNAGVLPPRRSVGDGTAAEFFEHFTPNVHGALFCTRAALPHLRRAPRSDVIFLSSSTLDERPPGRAAYVASKLAIEGMASVVAQEEIGHGVHINVVRCGPVVSDMGSEVFRSRGIDDMTALDTIAPFGRLIRPDDVGATVAFLCSPEALHINNATITINSGSQAWMPARGALARPG
jgi:NAD(P)-dependent dehydrogenase (short-subunit alcohol dehydrogenase family)